MVSAERTQYEVIVTGPDTQNEYTVTNSYDRTLGRLVLKMNKKHKRFYLLFIAKDGLDEGDMRRVASHMGRLKTELQARGLNMK